MRLPQPEELSALLDGELGAERASELKRYLALDPELLAQYEALRESDAAWLAAAATARFAPRVCLPNEGDRPVWSAGFVALAAGLLALRMSTTLTDAPVVQIGVHVGALAALLFGIVWIVNRDLLTAAAFETEA